MSKRVSKVISTMRQVIVVAMANFRGWWKNPKIWLSFLLGFIICFLLSDKILNFSVEHHTILQVMEPFIWTFGDSVSILIVSLPLLLIFSDMPNLGNEVPFFLIRTSRTVWLFGQILYLMLGTVVYVGFIFLSTTILAGYRSYPGNLWSDTAGILGYSQIGREIAVPAFLKVLELSFPYECTLHIFGLMICYALLFGGIVLFFNLCRKNAGMVGGIVFSCLGFLFNPDLIAMILNIPKERIRFANIILGWISPLNHATYYMHNFGYDNLPKLWVSYLFFGIGIVVVFSLSMIRIRRYAFSFTGTQKS